MIFSFSISTKLSSFYVPTFLKSNPSKQQSSQDLVHYLTKNRCRTEGSEDWAEHHCIVGFVRSNFLSGLCMAWPAISYVCPLLFHRLFVCIPHSLAHFWIPRIWLSTVDMPLHLLDFGVSGWLFGQRFFFPKNMDQFLKQWIFFGRYVWIHFWKKGLDFGRTDQFLEEKYQIMEELVIIWMNWSELGRTEKKETEE